MLHLEFLISIALFYVMLFLLMFILGVISDHSKTSRVLNRVQQELTELKTTTAALEKENQSLKTERDQLKLKHTDISGEYPPSLLKALSFDLPAFDWKNQDDVSRLHNALRENIEANCESITAVFVSQSPGRKGKRYTTTLTSCKCDDFKFTKKPCKHMFALALKMNVGSSPLRTHISEKEKT